MRWQSIRSGAGEGAPWSGLRDLRFGATPQAWELHRQPNGPLIALPAVDEQIQAHFKEHEQSLNSRKDMTGRFCRRPFELLEIHKEFYAFPCCPAWLPVIVGNAEQTSIEEVWNSKKMQLIRESIHDGSFRYCDHLECPEIQAGRLPLKGNVKEYSEVIERQEVVLSGPPKELALCYDETCNLACPSCRAHKIADISGSTFERKLKFTDEVLALLNRYGRDHSISLRVTGSGDPIASPIFYKMLKNLDGEQLSRVRICLQTNAVMLTEKVWLSLSKIHRNIDSIGISIDAATAETYAVVRKHGNWNQLQKNLRFLADLRQMKKIRWLSLNYVVQQDNYREMPAFVRLSRDLGAVDRIFFSSVNDWGTWPNEVYLQKCVWKVDHPEFDNFLEVLRAEELNDANVHLGNLTEYRKLALKQKVDVAPASKLRPSP